MFKAFPLGPRTDMVERGLIPAAIMTITMAAWTALSGNLKTKIEAISTRFKGLP